MIFIYLILILLSLSCSISSQNFGRDSERAFSHQGKVRCGGLKHSKLTRLCDDTDNNCGVWNMTERFWTPNKCFYQDISGEQARKCIGNRTIAFMGDSQIRDIAIATAYLLMDVYDLNSAPDEKFDIKGSGAFRHYNNKFDMFKKPDNAIRFYTYPKSDIAKSKNWNWQIQFFDLYNLVFLDDGKLYNIMNNNATYLNSSINKMDILFVNWGLHNQNYFFDAPQGKNYHKNIFSIWYNSRNNSVLPTVYTSLNPQCAEKVYHPLKKHVLQAESVEKANAYINKFTLENAIPYWDAGAVLRSSNRCNVTADGVHVKMYVDIMRAKMLFNHLCDRNMKWRNFPLAHFL